MARDPLATLPNLVSLSRVAMAAVFPLLDGAEARLLLIAAAAATDVADGWLARSRGSVTRSGALIDPLADRCFVLVAVFVLWWSGPFTTLMTLGLVARDIAVIAAWAVTRRSTRFRDFAFMARPAGKVVTALQFGALAAVYLAPSWLVAIVVAVAVASLVSIADYAGALWRGRAAGVLMLAGFATAAGAQGFRFAPRVQPEFRAQVIAADPAAGQAGFGVNVPAGYYVRLAGGVAAGAQVGGMHRRLVSADFAVRFLTDPFRERRWGPYAALGVRGDWEEGRHGRPAITLAAGADFPGTGRGWKPAFEIGFGGGARVALIVKPVRRSGR